jgi:hypothetical protein
LLIPSERRSVTGKADFMPEEWQTILEGPPSAGLFVATAQRGGTFRESMSIGRAYIEARKHHGESQLLDEIVNARPEIEHKRYHSQEEVKTHALGKLKEALGLLEPKATPDELEDYKAFVLNVVDHVAKAHREGFLGFSGEQVSDAERKAVQEIADALETTAPE